MGGNFACIQVAGTNEVAAVRRAVVAEALARVCHPCMCVCVGGRHLTQIMYIISLVGRLLKNLEYQLVRRRSHIYNEHVHALVMISRNGPHIIERPIY